jgi:hypothetical protein
VLSGKDGEIRGKRKNKGGRNASVVFVAGQWQQPAEVEAPGKVRSEEKVSDLEEPIRELLQAHRVRLLEIGAPARLMVLGEIAGVLPPDDAVLLDAARPVTREGKVRLDPVKV